VTGLVRIVHLSDIHVSDAHFLADVAGKVVDSINEIAPDIVVVTGDLTQNGSHPEFEGAARTSCQSHEGVTVVGVDSSQPDIDDGHVGRDLYDWIAKSFETDDFKVFALHHHLIPVPMTGREEQIPVDSGDVLELLDSHCGLDI